MVDFYHTLASGQDIIGVGSFSGTLDAAMWRRGIEFRTAAPEAPDRSPVDFDAQPQVTANGRSDSETIRALAGAGERATRAPIRCSSQDA